MSSTAHLNQQDLNRANGFRLFHWRRSSGWYLGAACLAYFADGRCSVPLAAWLFPALMLRFVRLQRPLAGLAITYGTLVVTRWFAFRGMVPLPGILYLLFAFISSFAALTPYLLDRAFAVHLRGTANSLAFPATLVIVQFLYEHGPFGSWGSTAYTQPSNLALLQILSVSGLWGVTFLIGWFAGTFNSVASHGVGDLSIRRGLAIFCFVLLATICAGEVRLNISPPREQTVRIASLSPNGESIDTGGPLFFAIAHGTATEDQKGSFATQTTAIRTQLLSRTALEADAGAKIVFWSEEAALVQKADEAQFVSQGRAVAAQHHIYLGMAMGTINAQTFRPVENKIVLITPAGDIAWQYLKARPTPGPEAQLLAPSDGRLLSLATPYGRLTAAICYDTDFPDLIAQAGRLRADIILSPANDWRGVDPRHTQMAQFRAIEQGISLVRQSSHGFSAAYDYNGRALAVMDAFQSPDQTLVAQIPIKGGSTLYTQFGDWVAWMSIALLIVLVGLCVRSFLYNTAILFRGHFWRRPAIQPMSNVKIADFGGNGESMFIRALVLAGCLTIVSAYDTQAQPSNEHRLHVELVGLRNDNGQVICELHTSATWLSKDNSKAVVLTKSIIAHNHATCEFSGISAGKYAVSVIHDENSNGKLDKNVLGMPREGFGMSNDVIPRFGPPKFEAVAFSFDGGTADIKILIRYL